MLSLQRIGRVITLLTVLIAATLIGCANRQSQSDAEQYIIEGARQWAESLATGDTRALERILADDFVGVNANGNVYDKATMIASIKDSPKYFASNELGQVTVRFFGETAVAQGEETWVMHTGDPISGRYVWTDIWVRRNGVWQVVAAQDAIAEER